MRVAVVVAAFVAASRMAAADPDPIGKRLFDEGRALYDQGKYIEACVLFEKSFELDPAPGTKLNLAECAERANKPRAAWLLWIAAAEEFERTADRRATFAHERADKLAPKLATVVVDVSKSKRKGLAITVGGRKVSTAGASIVERVDPGSITVTANAPDRKPFSTTVQAARGTDQVIEVPVLERIAGSKPDPEDDPMPERSGSRPWTIVAFAAGSVFVGSAAAWLYTRSRIHSTEDTLATENPFEGTERRTFLEDRGKHYEKLNAIATVVGTVSLIAVAVSVTKIVLARRAERVAVTPAIGPSGASATLTLRW
ncbi:MAG: tetratricopeptide repeat protein [Kofleriaceae bacterium]